MRYCFDNNLSPVIVRILTELDVDVFAIRDELSPNTPDVEIFEFLAGQDVTLITADLRINRVNAEAAALKKAGVSAVFLHPFYLKLDLWQQAEWMLGHWRDLDRFIDHSHKPVLCEVLNKGGKISHISV